MASRRDNGPPTRLETTAGVGVERERKRVSASSLPDVSSPPRLADVVAVLDDLYPPSWAESWDAVGLVCGDPDAAVRRVLFAIDPVLAVVDEAVRWGADLLVTHHPLLLRAVHGVPATDPKGMVVHRLISAGIGLHVAHTNADVAAPGVSDALARTLGLVDTRPLAPSTDDPGGRRGLGRTGTVPGELTLDEFVDRAVSKLPVTGGGLRVAGESQAIVNVAAVCGGAGDALLDTARTAGADLFLTADLRHHPSSESRERGAPALVDAAHWATEWPWLMEVARSLVDALPGEEAMVETRVSTVVTDPWTYVASSSRPS